MDRESLIISANDPNRSVLPSANVKDLLIAKLEAENKDLLQKLKKAKALLIKLDAKMKQAKQEERVRCEAVCPVCGFASFEREQQDALQESLVLSKLQEDVRQSRASRRPASPRTPPSANLHQQQQQQSVQARQIFFFFFFCLFVFLSFSKIPSPRRAMVVDRSPRVAASMIVATPPGLKVVFTNLPFRVVFLIVDFVGQQHSAHLALLNKEWAKNVALFKAHHQSTRLALSFYTEELEYRKKLQELIVYKKEFELLMTSDELSLVFSNVETLMTLSNILVKDLNERFGDWKAIDSIAEVFAIAVQGLRCYATYYANFEVILPEKQQEIRQKFNAQWNQIRTANNLRDIASLQKSPVERIDSVRCTKKNS